MNEHVYFVTEGEEGFTEVTITPKKYWDEHHCVADFEEDEAIVFFENIGFDREGDSYFVGETLTVNEMKNLLASNEMFIYDENFIQFAGY